MNTENQKALLEYIRNMPEWQSALIYEQLASLNKAAADICTGTSTLEQGFAENTGLTKSSGFCQYPLWHFKEDFLREIGGEVYEQYANCFQSYMQKGPFGGPGPAEEPKSQMGGMKMK